MLSAPPWLFDQQLGLFCSALGFAIAVLLCLGLLYGGGEGKSIPKNELKVLIFDKIPLIFEKSIIKNRKISIQK